MKPKKKAKFVGILLLFVLHSTVFWAEKFSTKSPILKFLEEIAQIHVV
jgi:hypothetical protein